MKLVEVGRHMEYYKITKFYQISSNTHRQMLSCGFLGNIKKPGVQSLWPPLMHFLKYLEYARYIKCFRAIVVSTFYNLLLHLYLFPIKIPMSYYYFTKGLQTNKKIMVQGYGSLVQVYSKKITSARSILISA